MGQAINRSGASSWFDRRRGSLPRRRQAAADWAVMTLRLLDWASHHRADPFGSGG